MNIYNKIVKLRDYITDVEMDDRDKTFVLNTLEDIERELDIEEDVYSYLNDEDNYE